MTTTTYTTEVVREDGDFAMLLNGELVGFARTNREAEDTLNELVYNLLTRDAAEQAAGVAAAPSTAEVPQSAPAAPARPRCPKCGEYYDRLGRCGCLYAVHTEIATVVAAQRGAYEPDAEEWAEVEWDDDVPAPVASVVSVAARDAYPAPEPVFVPVRYFLPSAALVAECIAELRRSTDGAQLRALDKAAYEVARGAYGLVLADAEGALLVPSRSAGGVVYRVTQGGCTCPAGSKGTPCWHRHGLYEAVLLARDVRAAELDDEADRRPLVMAA